MGIVYLIWSQKRNKWWRTGGYGYTDDIDEAGRFTEAEAINYVVSSANCGIREQVSYMVAAPDNWQPQTTVQRGPLADVLFEYFTSRGLQPQANGETPQ